MNVKSMQNLKSNHHRPILRFSPFAWAKLLFVRDLGPTEVGGFGVCPSEPLLVEDFQLVTQRCTYANVSFDDVSVGDLFEQKVDEGLRPDQFARIWIHTHPGRSADPSGTDELTFSRVFGDATWALMFILAREGATYARLRVGSSPRIESTIPVHIDCGVLFAGSDPESWKAEYTNHVIEDDCYRSATPISFSKSKNQSLASRKEEYRLYDDFLYDEHWPAY